MRKIFTAIIMFMLTAVPAMPAERFVAFPTIGVCTGSYVRYRSEPNTDADIWGRLQAGERVIVDSLTAVDGEIWYEILPKNAQDSAFVFGKYLVPYYDEEIQQSSVGKMIIKVLQTYCPYKDYDYYGEFNYPEVKRDYDRQGWLVSIEAWNPGSTFGEIEIGDNMSKLMKILGEPDNKSNTEWEYIAGNFGSITFRIKDGKITQMIYVSRR